MSFERLAPVYDATRGGLERGRAFAENILPFVSGPRILEVGVGTGAVAAPLAEMAGVPVLGLDVSPAMLALARDRLAGRVAIGDAERLPVATGSVDGVVAVWLLQLVPDIGTVLREIARVLRPAGRAVVVLSRPVQVPDDIQSLVEVLFERLGPKAPDGPHNVADLAGESGLVVIATGLTSEHRWQESPVEVAEQLEGRVFASLLDLNLERFEEVVVPIAGALRALPEPAAPRRRASRYHYVAYGRAGRSSAGATIPSPARRSSSAP